MEPDVQATNQMITEFSKAESVAKTARYLAYMRVMKGESPDIDVSSYPITFDIYQEGTQWTAHYPESLPTDVYTAMGLAGETGEVLEKCKKRYRDGLNGKTEEQFKEELNKELGDVLYYLAALALSHGIKLSDIAKQNQHKLLNRLHKNTIQGSGDNR